MKKKLMTRQQATKLKIKMLIKGLIELFVLFPVLLYTLRKWKFVFIKSINVRNIFKVLTQKNTFNNNFITLL